MSVWRLAKLGRISNKSVNGREFKIQMVRFDEPSRFGIRDGRISKLWAKEEGDAEVINYDRGWDIRPNTAEGKALLTAIIKQFN